MERSAKRASEWHRMHLAVTGPRRLHRMAAQEETFRLWQSIHTPMTLMFLVLTALHVIGALYFGGY